MLGSMLGDASMSRPGRAPIYSCNHGWAQAEYCWIKYLLLSEFVNTPPAKRKNGGYGEYSTMFKTVAAPAFESSYRLTCRSGIKRINRAWLDRIEAIGLWETIAWWIGDDGSLGRTESRPTRIMTLHTEGFPKEDVRTLARWLQSHGVSCTAAKIRRKSTGAVYWIVRCTVEGTRTLVSRVEPFLPPPMRYKAMLVPVRERAACSFCGRTFVLAKHGQARYESTVIAGRTEVCCRRPECRAERHRRLNQDLLAKPGKRAAKNAKQRETYHADPEASRTREREKAARLRAENPERYREYRRAWRAARAAERPPRTLVCKGCGTTFETRARAKIRYCGDACRTNAMTASRAKYTSRHPRSSRSSTPASTTCTTSRRNGGTPSSPTE